MTGRQYTPSADSLEFVQWLELTPERQMEILRYCEAALDRERQEAKFLRMLLLSNGGRTAEEIDNIMRGLK